MPGGVLEQLRKRLGRGDWAGPDVLVLSYHAVSPEWPAALAVLPERLTTQLEWLSARGYRGATVTEAVHAPPAQRTVAVTFDDAYRSVLELALPILDRFGMPGTVFVPTDFPDHDGPMSWPGIDGWLGGPHEDELRCLSWTELRDLANRGWEVGSHSCSHPYLTRLDDGALERELRQSRQRCEQELVRECRSLAYPYGDYDLRVEEAARSAGFTTAVTVPDLLTSDDPLQHPRIGIYRADGMLSFRAKVSKELRWARESAAGSAVLPLVRSLRRALPHKTHEAAAQSRNSSPTLS